MFHWERSWWCPIQHQPFLPCPRNLESSCCPFWLKSWAVMLREIWHLVCSTLRQKHVHRENDWQCLWELLFQRSWTALQGIFSSLWSSPLPSYGLSYVAYIYDASASSLHGLAEAVHLKLPWEVHNLVHAAVSYLYPLPFQMNEQIRLKKKNPHLKNKHTNEWIIDWLNEWICWRRLLIGVFIHSISLLPWLW